MLIAYHFPPVNVGGSHRAVSLANQLVDSGKQVVVITKGNVDHTLVDNSLEDILDKDLTVIQVRERTNRILEKVLNTGYFGNSGSEGWKWNKEVVERFKKIHKNYSPDLIIITAPPFSIIPIAHHLKKQYKIPYILDFRDNWSQWCIAPYASKIHYKYVVSQEYKYITEANHVISATPGIKRDLISVHSDLVKEKVKVLHNGFDAFLTEEVTTKNEHFIIGYIGSFYYQPYTRNLIFSKWYQRKPWQWFQYVPRTEDWRYRSPYYFFRIIRALIDEHPELTSRIKLKFVGRKPKWFDEMVCEFNLEDIVYHFGFIQKREVSEFIKSCDMMLATSSKLIGG